MTERELARAAAHRLAIIRHAQEVTGNVSLTCRYFGITRQAYYIWLRRYQEHGLDGLRDRSRRPHVSPNATRADVVGKIIYLRQSYHFGPHKIAMYLKRYHDIQISPSGIWRILRRLDMSRLPASQRYRRHVDRWKRYEKPLPGHRVQIDVKFIAPLQGSRKKHYQFTAIDDCTRIRCCGSTTGRFDFCRAFNRMTRPPLVTAGRGLAFTQVPPRPVGGARRTGRRKAQVIDHHPRQDPQTRSEIREVRRVHVELDVPPGGFVHPYGQRLHGLEPARPSPVQVEPEGPDPRPGQGRDLLVGDRGRELGDPNEPLPQAVHCVQQGGLIGALE